MELYMDHVPPVADKMVAMACYEEDGAGFAPDPQWKVLHCISHQAPNCTPHGMPYAQGSQGLGGLGGLVLIIFDCGMLRNIEKYV